MKILGVMCVMVFATIAIAMMLGVIYLCINLVPMIIDAIEESDKKED